MPTGRPPLSDPHLCILLHTFCSLDKPSFFQGAVSGIIERAIPDPSRRQFCTLLFFHFIPRGTAELAQPKNWARLFGLPELGQIA